MGTNKVNFIICMYVYIDVIFVRILYAYIGIIIGIYANKKRISFQFNSHIKQLCDNDNLC
jgi:hypothetical protein